ncbi:hypothetical protein BDW69DRAFT_189790 [Aspergillus filifer]
MATPWIDLHIGIGQSTGPYQQRHWILILSPHNNTTDCIFIHVTGGPAAYEHCIEPYQSICAHPFAYLARIGTIPPIFYSSILQICLDTAPRRCQEYIVSVLGELEERRLVQAGIAAFYEEQSRYSMWEVSCRVAEQHDAGLAISPADFVQLGDMARGVGLSGLEYCTCFF